MSRVGVNIGPGLNSMGQRIVYKGLDEALDKAGIDGIEFLASDRYDLMAQGLTYEKAVELVERINRMSGYMAKLV